MLSRRIYVHLLRDAQVLHTGFLTYKNVSDALGVFHRTIRGALYYIQDRCHDRGWPTLTVWIVRKDSGLPGGGCDVVEPGPVQETAVATKTISWPSEPWW
jgi:hypothetical protein